MKSTRKVYTYDQKVRLIERSIRGECKTNNGLEGWAYGVSREFAMVRLVKPGKTPTPLNPTVEVAWETLEHVMDAHVPLIVS